MCGYSFLVIVYIVGIYIFGIYLRFINFTDYFECYACKELNLREQNFDYIVVGSGSAGSIVARRLAEDKETKVLLIEAGSSGNSLLQIPSAGLLLQDSPFDWQYHTVPQKQACLGLDNQVSKWPMGKILGGTAMLNNMIYVRGHLDDFIRWYPNSCNFNYRKDILIYFKKLEDSETGSIVISDLPHKSSFADFVLQAGSCMGFEVSNGLGARPGFSEVKLTMRNGQRWTPYHTLARKKPRNLFVVTNSFVQKVLLRNDSEAYGVKYTHLGESLVANARKGVILSAGVIGSPKILMLSGIGPKQHLKSMKIPVKVDLPVGDNLQDHVTTGFDLITLDNYDPEMGLSQMMSISSMFKYFITSKGPWTSPGAETLAFFNTPNQESPELQFMVLPLGVTSDEGAHLRKLTGIGTYVWDNYFARINKTTVTVLPVVLHPRSRGTVRLKNNKPATPPVIDPNYLSDNYDIDILIQGIEMIKEFIATAPMKRLGARLNDIKFPGCEKFAFDTRPYWDCYIRHLTITSYHPVGTCAMGEVIEQDFQVKGVNKLYVVDGSILPDLPSGNPNGAIMMMAEKAAELIKHKCWLSQRKCCEMVFEEECQCS